MANLTKTQVSLLTKLMREEKAGRPSYQPYGGEWVTVYALRKHGLLKSNGMSVCLAGEGLAALREYRSTRWAKHGCIVDAAIAKLAAPSAPVAA